MSTPDELVRFIQWSTQNPALFLGLPLLLAGFYSALIYIRQHPGCLRRFATPAQLAEIDAFIEAHDAPRSEASSVDTEDAPDKHILEADERGGDGRVWVLTDDGEIAELEQLQR